MPGSAAPVIVGIRSGGLRLLPEAFNPPAAPAPVEAAAAAKPAKPQRVKKAAPELAARARELRDRCMASAARGEGVALPAPKYDIAKHDLGRRMCDDRDVTRGRPAMIEPAASVRSLLPTPSHQRLLPDSGESRPARLFAA